MPAADEPTPRCPWCKTPQHVQSSGTNLKAWYCRGCQREFEAGDDGVIGYGLPEKYAERAELAARRPPWRKRCT